MTSDEEQEALAAEYALGTLDAGEREQAELLIVDDPRFAALVRFWERRLGELNVMVDPVEPSADIWARIRERMGGMPPTGEIRLPELARPAPGVPPSNVVHLSRRLGRWRGLAAAASALAATLALFVAAWEFAPNMLPLKLRPPEREIIRTVTVEVPAKESPRLVAVLQKDAGGPAFLITVDTAQRTLTMRRVAAQPEPGKSYELWLVSDKFPAPRSLGVAESGEFTQRALQASYDPDTVNNATYAVSLEPEGGSPTGAPTGPVLFTGKLVEATPPASR
jgi:anti-sigma-K factor RskA